MMSRWPFALFLLIVVGVIGGIVLTRASVLAAPDQPIAFSHRVHNTNGVPCLYCHASALRSEVAGIPSMQLCMGCHSIIATDSPEIQVLTDYWESETPIPWARVNGQPDFVYYSHQPHLDAGINCETCHGDIGQMDKTQPAFKTDMGWCLTCHLQQPEEQVARLADCLICHK